jgi:hypothetical protein
LRYRLGIFEKIVWLASVTFCKLSLKPVVGVCPKRRVYSIYDVKPKRKALLEYCKYKRGWIIEPTVEVILTVIGKEFRFRDLGRLIR